MLYYLFRYLDTLDFPGAGVFNYLSFRSAAAVITSLIIAMLIGKRIIKALQRKQIGETIRDLDLEGQYRKQGTPSMGGIIILASILVPVLLFARLDNIYIILMIITTIWIGMIGFLDDYIKIFKKNKEGLAGRFKIIGQVTLGLIVAVTLYLSDDVVVRVNVTAPSNVTVTAMDVSREEAGELVAESTAVNIKSTKTTIPFVKNNEFDYSWLVPFAKGKTKQFFGWIVFMAMVILVVVSVSNGVNLTDGLDGLAIMPAVFVASALGIFAYATGNTVFSGYLGIPYIPGAGELLIYCGALAGAGLGFLWFNTYPAQVFMGDIGALAMGAALGLIAVIVRQELVFVVMAGVFVIETLSVILQVASFKLTGKRIFRMAPIHHHFELKGRPEPRVIVRFWIITVVLVLAGLATLKIR